MRVGAAAGRLGSRVVGALEKSGYVVDRQKGSHFVLRQATGPFRRVTVPDHKEIARGTLRSILRHAGLTKDESVELL